MTYQYAVLVDVDTTWPEVVFVGEHDEACRVCDRALESRPAVVQAVVSLDDALDDPEPRDAL